jgi:hypothetical protein
MQNLVARATWRLESDYPYLMWSKSLAFYPFRFGIDKDVIHSTYYFCRLLQGKKFYIVTGKVHFYLWIAKHCTCPFYNGTKHDRFIA